MKKRFLDLGQCMSLLRQTMFATGLAVLFVLISLPDSSGTNIEDTSDAVTQQKNKKTGKVIDEDGKPLSGVTVFAKGTNIGVTTDVDGYYEITIPEDTKALRFTFVGMKPVEIKVDNQTVINVKMGVDNMSLDEVVAVGYGSQKKRSITGAIATMDAADVEDIPTPNLSNALAGRLSGVFVNQVTGAPGYSADIRVRSVNAWYRWGLPLTPLYVIDGVISNKASFDALDYSEVDKLTVLKDAAAGAIYGARAGNGVILVTTKRGKKGKFKLNYNYSYSFDKPSQIPEYVDAPDMIRLNNYISALYDEVFADEEEIAFFNKNDPGKEWYRRAYSDPVIMKHSLSASGGTDKINYFVGTSYYDQTGFIKTSGFDKFNIRSNIDVTFSEEVTATFNIAYRENTTQRFAFQEDNASSFDTKSTFGWLWARLLYYNPFHGPTTSDGKYIDTGWVTNPLAAIEEGGYNRKKNQNTDFLMRLNYKVPFIDGLSFNGLFSRNYDLNSVKHYEVKPTVYEVEKKGSHNLIATDKVKKKKKAGYPSTERLGYRYISDKRYQLNIGANYSKIFGNHNIETSVIYEQSESSYSYFSGTREEFPLIYRDQIWSTGSSREQSYVGGHEYESGRASFIGQLAYQYSERFFLKAAIRRDGSMLFAPAYRWGNFPSISIGWVLSEEDFFANNFYDFFKIRASWGLAGNDVVGGWKWLGSYSSPGAIYIGSSVAPRVKYDGIVNEGITWEKTSEYNFGLDTRFLDGAIFNIEYYNRHNYDILDSRIVSLPSSFGGSMPPENYGIVDAHGIEVELGYSGSIGEFDYSMIGSYTYSKNKVVKKDVPENVRDVDNPIGRSTDYVNMLVATGIIRTQEELDALPENYTIYGLKPALGIINFEDVSGIEGVPDGKIDNYDKQIIKGKHYDAPSTYGLKLLAEWKGFGLDIFLQGILGSSKLYNDGFGRKNFPGSRPPTFWLDHWSPDNINAAYPQIVRWGATKDDLPSTFWLENDDYLRLQNLSFYYNFPSKVISKLKLSNATLRMSGTNLLTFSSFKYHDPSAGHMNDYPTMKTFTIGFNVGF